MIKKKTALGILLCLFCLGSLHAQTTAIAPSGSGTSGDPYLISTLGELSYVAQNLGATNYWASGVYFSQTADIDASGTQYWDDADGNVDGDLYNDPDDGTATGNDEGFATIGNSVTRFYGSYDGQGYTISNLYISRSSVGYVGFFGWIDNSLSTITDVHLSGGSITGGGTTGALAGAFWKGTMTSCSSSASVSSTAGNIGGLVGQLTSSGVLTDCYATGTVNGGSQAGGLVGLNQSSSATDGILRCYATGNVTTSGTKAGGLVGYNTGNIRDSYALGNASGSNQVGGLVGIENFGASTILNAYATGFITCPGADKGGLIGYVSTAGTYSNNFWDTETSGLGSSAGATGKTTAEMKTLATFTGAGWDFMDETTNGSNNYWGLCRWSNGGYPFLDWQGYTHDCGYEPHGGYALEFDGTDDYVAIAYDANLNPATLTIEAWVRVEGGSGTFRSVATSRSGTPSVGQGYAIYAGDDNNWQFWTYYESGGYQFDVLNSGVAVTTDWTHLTCVYDGSNKKIYVNGILVANQAGPYTPNTTYGMRIGAGYTESTPDYFLLGKVDEVRVWSDIRSQAEIQANMHKELAGNEANLVAYYAMTDGSGTTLTDNTGGLTGTLTNGPVWKTSGAHAGPDMALDFDGIDDYVIMGSSPAWSTNLTYEAWIKVPSNPFVDEIIGFDAVVGLVEFRIYQNKLELLTTDGSTWQTATGTMDMTDNAWHHVAFVKEGTAGKLYVDGIEEATQTFTLPLTLNYMVIGDLNIDGFPSGAQDYRFGGNIDEVRLWSIARTEAQLRGNMYRSLDGDEGGLEAYYRFDQQAATGHNTVYDLTSNGRHGTLTNMDATTDWVASTPFNTWIGSEDANWNNAENWSQGSVPGTEDVGIFGWSANNSPSTGNINAKNFYLDAGLTMSHSGNLTLSGDFYNAGTFTTSGTVLFSGSAAQTIRGPGTTTIGTLRSTNSNGLTMEQDVTVSTDLDLDAGTFSIGANTLTVNGSITRELLATLSGGSSSNLVVGGSGAQLSLPSVTLNNLTLNRANGLQVADAATVEGILTLTNGRISLSLKTLTLGESATIAGSPGASSHITGSPGIVRKQFGGAGSFTYPVGDGSNYTPINLNFSSGTFGSAFADVSLYSSKHGNNPSTIDYINRYWTVSSSGISGFSCNVTATYANGDIQGTESELHGGKWNGSAWTDLGAVNTGSNQITGTVSSFSDFTAGEATAFPVEWLHFSAEPLAKSVQLTWATASESNSDYYAIERSADQQTWEALGNINAAGNRQDIETYEYRDEQPLSGRSWYRLRQVDLDGAHQYSAIVQVHFSGFGIAVYPNPAQDQITVQLSQDQIFQAKLIDAQGRVLLVKTLSNRIEQLNISHLPAGVYLLQMTDQKGRQQQFRWVKE